MKQLSEEEIKEKLKAAFWDINIDLNLLIETLKSPKNSNNSLDMNFIYSRLLLSIKWYTLLKIVPGSKWPEMFSDEVIKRIFPKSLQKKYIYARSLLLQ
ncbi:MAG: hypothetical protein HY738_23765 [Bacteroidia bacterium]|nr:hypothetical protein [Bacteroidia bacterium]